MFEKLKNIFKKPTIKETIIAPNIRGITLNIPKESDEFYAQRKKDRGLDKAENSRIETEEKQAKQFAEEVERFKERQAVELAKKQEFYQQRKKERGLDNG